MLSFIYIHQKYISKGYRIYMQNIKGDQETHLYEKKQPINKWAGLAQWHSG